MLGNISETVTDHSLQDSVFLYDVRRKDLFCVDIYVNMCVWIIQCQRLC